MIFSFHSIRLQNYYCSKIFLWANLRSFKDISLDLFRLFWMRQVSKKHVWHICNCQLNARIVKIHDTPVLFILVTQKQPEMSREEEARALSPLFFVALKATRWIFDENKIFIRVRETVTHGVNWGWSMMPHTMSYIHNSISISPHNELYPKFHIHIHTQWAISTYHKNLNSLTRWGRLS